MSEELNLSNYSELFFKIPIDSGITYDDAKRFIGSTLYTEGDDVFKVTSISDDDNFIYINVEAIV